MRTEARDRLQELVEHVANVDDVLAEFFLGNERRKNARWIISYIDLSFTTQQAQTSTLNWANLIPMDLTSTLC